MLTANPIDLTSVGRMKSWLSSQGVNPGDADNLQACITAASKYWIWYCGLGPADNSVPTHSPFNELVTYTETYNGNGSQQMYLRNRPVKNVISLVVNLSTIQQSQAFGQPGWVIDGNARSIWIRGGGGGQPFVSTFYPSSFGGQWFIKGIQNVAVQYQAGFAANVIPAELATIPATAPYTIQVANIPFLTDGGVKYFSSGTPLTPVNIAPAVGQYFLQGGGVYLFNAADAGRQVLISYTAAGTPPDVLIAATQMVAVNYKRRSWIDQKSQMMPGEGTISYRDWELPPEVMSVMDSYKRVAIV